MMATAPAALSDQTAQRQALTVLRRSAQIEYGETRNFRHIRAFPCPATTDVQVVAFSNGESASRKMLPMSRLPMRSLRTTLILSCAALALVPLAPRPADARPRVGMVLGIAAGAALGLMGARRLHAARHHRPRHYAARPRARQVAHNRERSGGEEAAEAAQPPAAQAAQPPGAQAARPSRAMAARMAGGHVGWAGPVFWPYAYDDMFNYAFDRKSERGQFWSYGQGDILATVMPGANPQAALAASAGNMRLDSTRGSNRGGDTADSCLSASESNWTIDWIKQTVQLKDSQKAKFDELANAFNAAAEALTSTCPTKTAEKTDAKPADTKAADAK